MKFNRILFWWFFVRFCSSFSVGKIWIELTGLSKIPSKKIVCLRLKFFKEVQRHKSIYNRKKSKLCVKILIEYFKLKAHPMNQTIYRVYVNVCMWILSTVHSTFVYQLFKIYQPEHLMILVFRPKTHFNRFNEIHGYQNWLERNVCCLVILIFNLVYFFSIWMSNLFILLSFFSDFYL